MIDDSIIAKRLLVEETSGRRVELFIRTPTVDPHREETWTCKTEIRCDGDLVAEFDSSGSDSLQALGLAVQALRYGLKQAEFGSLSWLGMEGATGVPLVVNEIDEDFLTIVERLVDVELSRRALWQKALRSLRKKR